jgi:hypothetical protein
MEAHPAPLQFLHIVLCLTLTQLIAKPAAGTGAVFNEDGVDADFRVESDTNTHAFFLEGSSGNVGIGTSSPGQRLDVTGAAATFAGIRITGSAFQDAGFVANRPNSGNSASLYFTEAGANVAAIHSRGSSYGSGLNGALQIINGSNSLTLDSSGNLIQTVNTTAATLTTNQTLTFSIVDNSTLRISVRGSDGTTRTATVALT